MHRDLRLTVTTLGVVSMKLDPCVWSRQHVLSLPNILAQSVASNEEWHQLQRDVETLNRLAMAAANRLWSDLSSTVIRAGRKLQIVRPESAEGWNKRWSIQRTDEMGREEMESGERTVSLKEASHEERRGLKNGCACRMDWSNFVSTWVRACFGARIPLDQGWGTFFLQGSF